MAAPVVVLGQRVVSAKGAAVGAVLDGVAAGIEAVNEKVDRIGEGLGESSDSLTLDYNRFETSSLFSQTTARSTLSESPRSASRTHSGRTDRASRSSRTARQVTIQIK